VKAPSKKKKNDAGVGAENTARSFITSAVAEEKKRGEGKRRRKEEKERG
jgi:hypothetical protein